KKENFFKTLFKYLFAKRAVTSRAPTLRNRDDIFSNFKFICKGSSMDVIRAGESCMVYNEINIANHIKLKKIVHYNLKRFHKKLLTNALFNNNAQIASASKILGFSKFKIKKNIFLFDWLYRIASFLNLNNTESKKLLEKVKKLEPEQWNKLLTEEYNLDLKELETKTKKQKILTMQQINTKVDESFNNFFKDYFDFLHCDKKMIKDIYVGDYDGNGIDDTLVFVGSWGKVLNENGFHSDSIISPFPLCLKSSKGRARIFSINDLYNNMVNTELTEHLEKINKILRKSLACYPRDRYKNVGEMMKDIGEIAFQRGIYNAEREKAKIYGLLKSKSI
ncbi:MAG: hypothetical protein AB1633_10580, partial [Elusimicrobiota bacterium]